MHLQDKRYHIVEELYRNERDYVEALTLLIEVVFVLFYVENPCIIYYLHHVHYEFKLYVFL